MASILNSLFAKGYCDDMIDWYAVTDMLDLHTVDFTSVADSTSVANSTSAETQLPKSLQVAVTTYHDFEKLYAWANQSNVRSINMASVNTGVAMQVALNGVSRGRGVISTHTNNVDLVGTTA